MVNFWKKIEYETWDEAFRGLSPIVRQQSVRVAAYTQVLFLQACESGFGKNAPGGPERIKAQYGDLAYKCGLYHQLGKALVPPEYQLWREDFTEEEIAVYQKYTTDGRALVASLQTKGQRSRERRRGQTAEMATQNVPWLMIRESCEQHMERWNGTGFPGRKSGNAISTVAQIVGIAKELDRLAAETKSEDPFDDAYTTLLSQEGFLWSAELLAVLKESRAKCRGVYNKYIHYTMTLPKTVHLVEKRPDRPMGLLYRPMVSDKEGTVAAYEAEAWFGAIANRPGDTEPAADIHDMLVRTDMIGDMTFYFLYEAADAVHRMQNCKLKCQQVIVQMLPGFYQLGTQLQRFNELYDDQQIDKNNLILTVPEEVYQKATKAQKEIMGRYLRSGVALMLDGYHPENVDYAELLELGFRHIRFAPELSLHQETAEQIQKLQEVGFLVYGSGADTFDLLAWQVACGVVATRGTLTGVAVTEDELIRDCLLRER